MCNWKAPVLVVGLMSAAFVAGRVLPASPGETAQAQPAKEPGKGQPGKADPAMEAMMKAMQPGPEHRVLDSLVGSWEGSVKMWMAPGQSPQESKGTMTREWTLDGRWLKENVDATTEMGQFKGLSFTGYNPVDKKYESAWFENMSPWMMASTGTYDAAKKTFTFSGDCIDPTTMKRSKTRMVMDKSSPDKETMVGYGIGPDGKEFKNFEGTFTRKK